MDGFNVARVISTTRCEKLQHSVRRIARGEPKQKAGHQQLQYKNHQKHPKEIVLQSGGEHLIPFDQKPQIYR